MEVPLVVFVNTKSGGLQGTKLIEKFKKCIPPENVFDLSRDGPLPGLQKYGGQRFRIIVCGGDGSVGWVLTEIEKLKLAREMTPPVAILPIGTGNDLSRVLKWGGTHKGTKLKNFISKIEKACVVLLDKWQLNYTSDVQIPHEHHSMHNYFSIGADASIALQFHEMRLAHPEKFSSRTQNLAWYVRLGLQNFSSDLLSPYVSVEINETKVALPENTRCLVVLNVPSYSGGGNPWGTKKSRGKRYTSPTIDDGLLEVVAVNGPLQLVGIHANIIRGKRLGQGDQIKITMTKALPAQVDGEPWTQPPSIINIQLAGKSHMLANSLPTAASSSANASNAAPSEASSLPATSLLRQPSVYGINRTMSRSLVRTRSSSAPMAHTPSPIKYGPIAPTKRRKGRLYCEGCNLEFYLPYMLVNHMNSGLCANGSAKTENVVKLSGTPPATLSVQLGDGASTTDATSSHDSDDEGGIWRTQSAEVSGLKIHIKDSAEGPWTKAVEQAPVAASPASPRNDAPPASPRNDPPPPASPRNDAPPPASPRDNVPPASPRDALSTSAHIPSPTTSEPAPHEPSPSSSLDDTPAPTPSPTLEPEHTTPADDTTTHPVHDESTTPPTTTEGEEEEERVHESGSPSASQNFPPTHEEEDAAEGQAERS